MRLLILFSVMPLEASSATGFVTLSVQCGIDSDTFPGVSDFAREYKEVTIGAEGKNEILVDRVGEIEFWVVGEWESGKRKIVTYSAEIREGGSIARSPADTSERRLDCPRCPTKSASVSLSKRSSTKKRAGSLRMHCIENRARSLH